MYKMSVIIPCYKATETISATLHSIAMQSIAKDVEVIVVNDCDNLYYGDIIQRFKPDLNIRLVYNKKNLGCGGARNTGIREAMADWICFIDADDQFTSSLSLEVMYNRIKAERADILSGVFESEGRFADGVAIKKMERKPTWCHSKVYRKQFLLDNNLFFDERLRLNEDCLFHQLAFDMGAKVVEIPMVTLMWRDNPKSVTHESRYKNKRTYLDAVTYYLEEVAKRGMNGELVTRRVLQNLVMVYQYYNYVLDETPENDDDYLEGCKRYWKLCEPIVKDVEDDEIKRVFLGIMRTSEDIPNVTFMDFLNMIRS